MVPPMAADPETGRLISPTGLAAVVGKLLGPVLAGILGWTLLTVIQIDEHQVALTAALTEQRIASERRLDLIESVLREKFAARDQQFTQLSVNNGVTQAQLVSLNEKITDFQKTFDEKVVEDKAKISEIWTQVSRIEGSLQQTKRPK
jgi:hypothetical protein